MNIPSMRVKFRDTVGTFDVTNISWPDKELWVRGNSPYPRSFSEIEFVLPCAGKKDLRKRDIYNGDMLRDPQGAEYIVDQIDNGRWVLWLEPSYPDQEPMDLEDMGTEHMERIGSIYDAIVRIRTLKRPYMECACHQPAPHELTIQTNWRHERHVLWFCARCLRRILAELSDAVANIEDQGER